MTSEADQFWDEIAPPYRQFRKLCSMSYEEAEAAFQDAPEIPMSEEEIENIVHKIVNGVSSEYQIDPWVSDQEQEAEEGLFALHREEGVLDPEAAATEEELRQRMLNDESLDEETGIDGESTLPGDGQKDS